MWLHIYSQTWNGNRIHPTVLYILCGRDTPKRRTNRLRGRSSTLTKQLKIIFIGIAASLLAISFVYFLSIFFIPMHCNQECCSNIDSRCVSVSDEHWQNSKSCYNSSIWGIVKKSYIISVVRAVWTGGAFHRQPKYDFDTRFGIAHIVNTNINLHITMNLKTR